MDAVISQANHHNPNLLVVLIDDDYLGETQGTWPIAYGNYVRFLDVATDLCPAGVFIDMVFRHSPEEDQSASLLSEYLKKLPSTSILPQCQTLKITKPPKIFLPEPTFQSPDLSASNLTYVSIAVERDGVYPQNSGAKNYPTPAFAIAQELCPPLPAQNQTSSTPSSPVTSNSPTGCDAFRKVYNPKAASLPERIQLGWYYETPSWLPFEEHLPECRPKSRLGRLYLTAVALLEPPQLSPDLPQKPQCVPIPLTFRPF